QLVSILYGRWPTPSNEYPGRYLSQRGWRLRHDGIGGLYERDQLLLLRQYCRKLGVKRFHVRGRIVYSDQLHSGTCGQERRIRGWSQFLQRRNRVFQHTPGQYSWDSEYRYITHLQ